MARLSSPRRFTRFLPAVSQLENRCTPAALVVNSMNDTVAVDGAVTLREAIQSVNAGANVNADVTATGYGTNDTITFDTSVFNGVFGTITLTSDLTPITRPVVVNGPTTGAGFNLPLVTVDGNNNSIFVIQAADVTLHGLSIVDSATNGVLLGAGATNALINGNYIGLRADGLTGEGNRGAGIFIGSGATNSHIGGTYLSHNVISGNSTGVILDGAGTTGNVLVGNSLGTDRTGFSGPGLANGVGVSVRNGASNNTISNITIRNSLTYGMFVSGAGTTGNVLTGNSVFGGTTGVRIEGGATNTRVGGQAAGNSISGGEIGMIVTGAGTTGTVIAANYIGGLQIDGGATNTRVGGAAGEGNNISGRTSGEGLRVLGPATDGTVIARNAISENRIGLLVQGGPTNTAVRDNFIFLNTDAGIALVGQTAGVSITGNRIGTNVEGTARAGNGVGVRLGGGTTNVTVGGTTAADRNLISGNGTGVQITGAGTTGNVVVGNYIGTNATGTAAVPNNVGVEVSNGASGNTIGGTAAGTGNVIAFNRQAGVFVDAQTSGVQILGNSIYSNAGPGIDLSAGTTPDGETANDPQDPDTGGNGLQNSPVFTSVVGANLAGVLNSTPNRTFRVELFATDPQPPSRFGQGQRFLGAVTVTTDASGTGSFTFTAPSDLTGQVVSATATDLTTNSTSEFGLTREDALVPRGPKSVLVVGSGPGGPAVVVVYNPDGSERGRIDAFPGFTGGVRVATADVNGDGNLDIIAAAGPGGGPHVKVFDGVTGAEIRSFYAYDPSFTGGVWVAAGQMGSVGYAEIVTGAGAGGAPHVRVFDGKTGAERVGFYAYAPSFNGGVTVAVGDSNNDGFADEIITGAGAGGAPHVKVIEVPVWSQVNADGTINDSALLASFYAYSPTFAGGVFVSGGADFDHDGRMDIVTGAGTGGGPHVKVIAAARANQQAADGTISDTALLGSFYAYDATFTGGVRVGVSNVDQNGDSEVVVGPGPGIAPRVRVLRTDGQPVGGDFYAFDPTFTGGVFVN